MDGVMPSEEYLLLLAAPLLSYYSQQSRPNTDMERFVAFALSKSHVGVLVFAVIWLAWRAYQVLSKPSEELISLLGLEVPVPPALSLAGIRADGVVLNWKAPDQQKQTTVKHYIHINGVNVGELSLQETSIAVTGLRPETNYIIRVIAVNPSNFEAKSEAIRVQTKASSSGDFFQEVLDHGNSPASDNTAIPTIQPCKTVVDPTASLPAPPPMHREHSGSMSQQKRGAGARRVSPAVPLLNEDNDSAAYEGSVGELTSKLDKLRGEIESSEADLTKEDEEFETGQASLSKLKNELKQAVADKEGASKSLKKQAQDLTNQNSVAQGRRTAAEKQLQQKHQERQKLRDDIDRWDKEIIALRADAERLDAEKITYRAEADEKIAELKEAHAKETTSNKCMEESLRLTITKIKDLEGEKERLDQEEPDYTHGNGSLNRLEDMAWAQRLQNLQFAYQVAHSRLEQAKEYAQQAQLSLGVWQQRRSSQPQLFVSTPTLDLIPGRRHSQRGSRTMSLRNELSPQGPIFDPSSAPPYTSSMSSISPAFPSASPFFNFANGAAPPDHMSTMSPSEIELLTAGAPTSPSVAGALLPAGLLGDESEPSRHVDFHTSSNRSSPVNANVLPGLGAPQTLEKKHRDPSSPSSNQSGSPRVFASPRGSSTHLPFNAETHMIMDSDGRSIRSTTSSMRNNGAGANTTTRFANLFGFNRQRGKTFSDEGPTLGSLRQSERQSFPRQDGADHQPTTIGFRRRGSLSGGNWMGTLQNPFSRNSDPPPANAHPVISAPRSKFKMFGSKVDPWPQSASGDRPASPRRPDSSASSEHVFPKPSADAQHRFGWGDAMGQRQSPLGADWGLAAPNSWSRHPSRRPSIQHGSSLNFADSSFFEGADADYTPQRRSPKLAPIGTRPASQISTGSAEKPRLNPAAPSFKTIFSFDKKADREDRSKSKKGKGKESLSPDPSSPDPRTLTFEDALSPDAKSKYAPSVSTTGDGSENRESLEQTSSRTPSEATPGANGQKETFMQKLSRKSSASMFNFPGFGKEKSGRFKKSSQQGDREHETPDETDEEGTPIATRTGDMSRSFEMDKGGASPLVGSVQSRDSKEKDRSSGFSFRSLTSRRKGDKTPSLHESVTSETGDEEDGVVGNETWTNI